MPTPAEIRQRAIDELEAAWKKFEDRSTLGDTMLHVLTERAANDVEKIGYLYVKVKRNEMRSDNAL